MTEKPMDDRRYYGLDALRGGMMMLGIVLHGATFYLASPPAAMPFPTDRNNAYVFDLLFHFIHSFRMPAFFLLAGFFTALLVEKRGLMGTYKNRAARVVAPMLVAALTVLPLAGLFGAAFMLSVRFGTHTLWPDLVKLRVLAQEMREAGVPLDQTALGHLWFLYYLCYFYLLIPLCRLLVRCTLPVEQRIRKLLASPFSLLLLALYTAATLWPFRGGQVHEGFIFIKPHLPSLVYYGSFFVFGYGSHHYREFMQLLARYLPWSAAAALLLFPLSLYLSYVENTATTPGFRSHLAAVLAHAFCTWALMVFVIGSALRFLDRPSPWILYTSQSSYWVFLWHLPVISLAAWWMLQFDLPAEIKFLCVTSFTALVCFASYHYWVQRTWLSVFLNGRRFDMDWPWVDNSGRTKSAKPSA
jgi:glucans biosynthesis protein C